MHYEGNIIRPPSEANSILLQITAGCSHNKCTFCGAYKDKRFNIKKDSIIMNDIAFAAQHFRRQSRLFLCDGDALIIPQKRLIHILTEIKKQLPWVTRVSTYANAKSINSKTPEQLKELYNLGLTMAYMGLETGDDVTLKQIIKGSDSQRLIDMGKKIREAGYTLSITVLLGIAGRERSLEHAKETGRVLSAIDPEYVGALSLMLIPGTPMYDDYTSGEFSLPTPEEMLLELKIMIENTNLTNGLFHANHASNYLPIRAKLPQDKKATIELINKALKGKINLKPEHMRAL
ncbi:MAG: radical SAM protein [Desulfobacteraceae bacterium 4572_19]|nr:MAG: radical SAM protein [Desulfobacteraceae bacterium 4572_19]